jgi:hypothetical protein
LAPRLTASKRTRRSKARTRDSKAIRVDYGKAMAGTATGLPRLKVCIRRRNHALQMERRECQTLQKDCLTKKPRE